AGSGRRMGAEINKLLLPVAGRPPQNPLDRFHRPFGRDDPSDGFPIFRLAQSARLASLKEKGITFSTAGSSFQTGAAAGEQAT
ncbi:MAG: hypothetical protein ACKOOH_01240, partial [Cyanobium sp.]